MRVGLHCNALHDCMMRVVMKQHSVASGGWMVAGCQGTDSDDEYLCSTFESQAKLFYMEPTF